MDKWELKGQSIESHIKRLLMYPVAKVITDKHVLIEDLK